jgi:hypothetical protein
MFGSLLKHQSMLSLMRSDLPLMSVLPTVLRRPPLPALGLFWWQGACTAGLQAPCAHCSDLPAFQWDLLIILRHR